MRASLTALPLAAALLLTGCTGDSDDGREERSAAYTAAVEQWRQDELAPVEAAVTKARFSDLVVVDRLANAKETAAQRVRCTAIAAARDAVTALAPPPLEGTGTAEAERLRDVVTASTQAWTAVARPVLGELVTYCAGYAAGMRITARIDAAERALQATKSRFGLVSRSTKQVGTTITTTTVTCKDKAGCLPSAPGPRRKYLAAYKLARITLKQEQFRVYGGLSAPCRLSDYRPVCAVFAARVGTTVRFNSGFWNAVRTTPPFTDEARVDKAAALADAESRRFTTQLDAAFAATFPGLDRTGATADARNQVRLLKAYERRLATTPVPVTDAPPVTGAPPG